ncbi:MAG TPA: hypothetical protein VN924_15015 [Bryobacteraceae bacterium]|nr:hypothetical protein [Bryobacteraceae bacterium]
MASMLVAFLVGVAALCPAVACPLSAASPVQSGCCSKPAKTAPDCPYSILAKSKTAPAAVHAKWIGAIVHTERRAALSLAGPAAGAPSRVAVLSGLYLRNRVLLI